MKINLKTLKEFSGDGFITTEELKQKPLSHLTVFFYNYTPETVKSIKLISTNGSLELTKKTKFISDKLITLEWKKDGTVLNLEEQPVSDAKFPAPFSIAIQKEGEPVTFKYEFEAKGAKEPTKKDGGEPTTEMVVRKINPYYDALKIANYSSKLQKLKSLLNYFTLDDIRDNVYFSKIYKQVADSIKDKNKDISYDNLKIIIGNSYKPGEAENESFNPFALGAGVSSLGGLNITTFADEFSQFLIDRARQELNIAFFQRLKTFFDKTPEIRVLFPKTADALENLLSYEYPTMLQTLKNVFHEDLKNVFFKTDDVFKLPKYKPLVEEFPEILLSLKAVQVIAQIDNERHPSDILTDFTKIPEWKDEELEKHFSATLYNFRAAFLIGHLFSEGVRFVPQDRPFVLKKIDDKTCIVQLDTGIAQATKKDDFFYKTDTIQREGLEGFTSALAINLRQIFDSSKITDQVYRTSLVKNLFGNKMRNSLPTIAGKDIETLIAQVEDIVIANSSTFRESESEYTIDKMIRSYGPTRAWATRQHLNYLVQDKDAFNIFLGILSLQAKAGHIQLAVEGESETGAAMTLIRGSVLSKGTTLSNTSTINGDSALDTLKGNTFITERSTLGAGSKPASGSTLYIPKDFSQLLLDNQHNISLVRDYFVEFIERAEEVDRTIREVKEKLKSGGGIDEKELHSYINYAIDLLEYATNIPSLFQEKIDIGPYLTIARNGNVMYLNIVKKEYGNAVNNLITILETISREVNSSTKINNITSSQSDTQNKINSLRQERKQLIDNGLLWSRLYPLSSSNNAVKQVFSEKIKATKENSFSTRKFRKFSQTTSKIFRYGTFMANIIKSDSAAEIQAAIKAAALPVGSYTIKRESRWNISINSYVGAVRSREFLDKTDFEELEQAASQGVVANSNAAPAIDRKKTSFAAWAPLGIAASYGIGGKKSGGSISLYFTLFDFGAVLDYRVQNPKSDSISVITQPATLPGDTLAVDRKLVVSELPELTLKNFIAPGAYLVYGIPKLPISIGGGYQRGPQLRKIELSDNGEVFSTIEAAAYRWNFFIAVDIPLVTLFNRPK
ncbi:MAG: hypothetical protein RIG77_16335 [Cyclobacteriaceae bacterium]